MATKRQLTKQETQQAIPILKEFNKLSKAFIGLLSHKVETKKKRVHTLSVLVNDFKIPVDTRSTLSITTFDISRTQISRKGSGKFNQRMKWEADFRKRNRGIVL